MADVGVHRLAAGDDQHQRAENEERVVDAGAGEEFEAVERIEGGENLGPRGDPGRAERGDRREPDREDRPEHDADPRRSLELDGEEADEQRERDRNDGLRQRRRRHRQSLDGGEHADRRRDDAVAEQQARAQHQRPQQHAQVAVAAVVQQAVEREDAALAVVLRA